MSWWEIIRTWLANWFGQRAGRADQRNADEEKNNEVAQAVQRAEGRVPADAAAVDDRLRNGPGL